MPCVLSYVTSGHLLLIMMAVAQETGAILKEFFTALLALYLLTSYWFEEVPCTNQGVGKYIPTEGRDGQ